MNIADIVSKPEDKPSIITLSGDAGTGKTTLAATFPNPIFIRAEDGLQSIPSDIRPDAFPVIRSVDDLQNQMKMLKEQEHNYNTVVIDSITQLESMFIQQIVKRDPKKPKSINQACGGYGAGRVAVGQLHGKLRKMAQNLNNKGMFVVFIAHSTVTTVESPDKDPYTRYDLDLGKHSTPHYVNNVDMVSYLKVDLNVISNGDRSKAISTGERVAVCHSDPAQISKNRYGIDEALYVDRGVNPFIEYIPYLKSFYE